MIATFGSLGDLFPALALGQSLQQQGYTATIATMKSYQHNVEQHGLNFAAISPNIPNADPKLLAKIMHPLTGIQYIIRHIACKHLAVAYEELKAACRDADVLISADLIYPAPLVAETTRIPWVSYVLAPTSYHSAYTPVIVPPFAVALQFYQWFPTLYSRYIRTIRRLALIWGKPYHDFRKTLGLPPVSDVMFRGKNSPELMLAMFSKVLSLPQPDWENHVLQVGFPFLPDTTPLSPRLQAFLDAGAAPIVFTLGSAFVHAPGDFYPESIRAIQGTAERAVLLVGEFSPLLTQTHPENICVVDYAPHEALFSRAKLVVHQGGVGTTAQALRAGIPSLIVPFAYDQPDNALRVKEWGAGEFLLPQNYTAPKVKALLLQLQHDRYTRSAKHAREIIAREGGVRQAAQAIAKYVTSVRN